MESWQETVMGQRYRYDALTHLLHTAMGLSREEAAHVSTALDRLRLCGKGSDDWFQILIDYGEKCQNIAFMEKYWHLPRNHGLVDCHQENLWYSEYMRSGLPGGR
jgi:hypothetical protein